MATYTATAAKTITLVANQVDTITLTGTGTILHMWQTSTTPIYMTFAQPGQVPATPTIGGDECYAIMNNNNSNDFPWSGNGIVVKMICAAIATVNVVLHSY
jgi:hypothetical protein